LLAAHNVADYWAQTTHQAANKGRHGTPYDNAAGRTACLAHATTYTLAGTGGLSAANRVLRLGINWRGIAIGELLAGALHYYADRRYTLRALAARTGRLEFYDQGGAHLLDQSYHVVSLALSALIAATVRASAREQKLRVRNRTPRSSYN
jgi:hypothetical protein